MNAYKNFILKKSGFSFLRNSLFFIVLHLFFLIGHLNGQVNYLFRDASRPIDQRLNDLISRLTLDEKISLLGYNSKAIDRLGIPAYNWWNEALHGVARAGKATIFPQAIGMAATFNDSLVQQIADVISTEARAKYNLAVQQNNRIQYMGLTFWSPNINIFRDPRWGRGQETYGEDPYLTATMGTAFVRGMQGRNNKILKTAAAAKHLAVHSGPEISRHSFNAIVDEKDLRETYLYAFKKLVDTKVEAIMCAYNRVNGQPCCTGDALINAIVRNEWGFKGHIVTDCWALDDVFKGHKVLNNPVEVAAAAIKAGINMDCSGLLQDNISKAIGQKLLTSGDVDAALIPSLRTLFKLGIFNDPNMNPYGKLGEKDVNNARHKELTRVAAQQSMVLLKNSNNLLPLKKENYRSIMVIGPNAASAGPLLANYHGISTELVTFAEGITNAVSAGTLVQYEQGCDNSDTSRFAGIWAAGFCDLIVAVVGLNPTLEGEEGDAFMSKGGGDKISLDLPYAQIKLLQQLKKTGKPIVVIVTAGSDIDIAAIQPYADAILLAWYPGEQGGNAAADILFGKISPAGRLPVTFYNRLSDIPAYDNYSMQGRTYRYFNGAVQYPFGYGLSYTSFSYQWNEKPVTIDSNIRFSVNIENTGKIEGDEVVQVYIKYPELNRMPVKELKAFKRVKVGVKEKKKIDFIINTDDLKKWDVIKNQWILYPGDYTVMVGSNSADEKLAVTLNIKN
jgi:beta-glucosidase